MSDRPLYGSRMTKVWHPALRFVLGLLGLFSCYRLSLEAATAGTSRLFSTMAIIESRIERADTAVRLAPTDPEAHYTRALTLVNLQRLDEAVTELREATQLRPHHYYEWLDLGVTLDRLGDQQGALDAFNKSIQLAPGFAQPRWQLGNLLFRQSRYEEAFSELRLGSQSNPNLFESMMQLAWGAADGDVPAFKVLMQPRSREAHLRLASFLAKREKGTDAAHEVAEAGEPQTPWERQVLHQTIKELINAGQFSDAYLAWMANHRAISGQQGQLLNGDFVDPIMQDDPGFGWQLPVVESVSVSIDPAGPRPNARSLRLEFKGESGLENQLVSQMVLLQPNRRYSLTFMARSADLVTGGPPVMNALAIGNKTSRILGRSDPVAQNTSGWTPYKVDFVTDDKASPVIFALQRLSCSQSPCPIFGKLWLSNFVLTIS